MYTIFIGSSENSEVKVYDENADYVLFNIRGKSKILSVIQKHTLISIRVCYFILQLTKFYI